MRLKKLLAVLLVVSLMAGTFLLCVSSLEPRGNGIVFRDWAYNDPAYTFSEAYMTSRWFDNFSALVLTENERNNVLRVALSQLGYHEGDTIADIHGMNSEGDGNVTEYARLILTKTGLPIGTDNVDYAFDWCACFVNWCLNQARVDHAYAEISCGQWLAWFSRPENEFHVGKAFGGTYIPRPADLIFFDWEGKNAWPEHIGFVLYTDDATVYTIEGNTKAGDVGIRSYPLNSKLIRGYGVPAYAEGREPTFDYAYTNGFRVGEPVMCAITTTLTDGDGQAHDLPVGTMVSVESLGTDGMTITVRYGELVGIVSTSALRLYPSVMEDYTQTETDAETEDGTETASDTETEALPSSETEISTEGGNDSGTGNDTDGDTEEEMSTGTVLSGTAFTEDPSNSAPMFGGCTVAACTWLWPLMMMVGVFLLVRRRKPTD